MGAFLRFRFRSRSRSRSRFRFGFGDPWEGGEERLREKFRDQLTSALAHPRTRPSPPLLARPACLLAVRRTAVDRFLSTCKQKSEALRGRRQPGVSWFPSQVVPVAPSYSALSVILAWSGLGDTYTYTCW